MKNPYGWGACFAQPRNLAYLWQLEQSLELLQPERWMTWHWEQPVDAPGFVPTLWSNYCMQPHYRDSIVKRLQEHGPETWLFLNEPHLAVQANMTPQEAVDMAFWLLNLAREVGADINWCGPNCAVNMHDGPLSGKAWMQEWLRLMRRAGIGGPSQYGVHFYNGTDRAMVSNIWTTLRNEWRWQFMGKDLPVIVTEHCAENNPLHMQIEVMDELARLYEIGLMQGGGGLDGIRGAYWFVAFDYSRLHPGSPFDWPNCTLCEVDPDKTQTMRLTPLGRHWKDLQERLKQ